MTASEGWYVDSDNPTRDVYWAGEGWSGDSRPTVVGTPPFPGDAEDQQWVSQARAPQRSDVWTSRANLMYLIAALAGLGAVIGGIVLLVRTGQDCTSNPYNASLVTCTDTHPFVVAGIAVIVAGLLQALVVYTVGRLCAAQADRG
jgi:hypothetical protein